MTETIPAAARPAFRPTHPGAVLRDDVLPALDLTVVAAAAALGVSRQMLHRILAEEASVTPDMAARIGKLCGNGARPWLAMQQAHDLWQVEADLSAEIAQIPTMRVA